MSGGKNKDRKKGFRVSFAEIMVNLASDGLVLALPTDLRSRTKTSIVGKALSDSCHIYFVLRRPGLRFVPESIKSRSGSIFGMINLMRNGDEQVVDFAVPQSGFGRQWTVNKFPHRLIESEAVFPSHKLSLPSYVVPSVGRVAHASAHEAEVLYIGQSFGNGHRTALDRLIDHSTLQSVLADATHHTPDQDILLLLVEYARPKLCLLIPPESTYSGCCDVNDVEVEKEIERRKRQISQSNIPLNNQISIIEAALINYFKPPYNDIFVRHKPQSGHQHLMECYNEDFSALVVEINTEDAQIALYSSARPPGMHHLAQFDLHDPKTRKTFFRLSNFDSEVGMLQSGPIVPIQSLRSGRLAFLSFSRDIIEPFL